MTSTFTDTVKLEPTWKSRLLPEFMKPYMQALRAFLQEEKQASKQIYPKGSEIFKAFELTPFDQVKVVILGQDPYHQENQAHGLCFSVRPGIPIPPSLRNIYKELETDLGLDFSHVTHGCLEPWANQGVLLLNAVLTVEDSKAGAHQGRGWETFTDRVIDLLNREKENLVFILWGSYAQKKGEFIDTERHLVIRSPHPSPLSAHRGFLGSRPFSQTNDYLIAHGKTPINWQISPSPRKPAP
jgi:uracil-DNA glycosylase